MVGEEIKQWIIFLCYSEEDKLYAQQLYRRLHSMNISVWFDLVEILHGDSRLRCIGEGLQSSLFLLVIISQHTIEAPWVKAELEPAILEQVNQERTTVLPVTLDNTSPSAVSPFLKGRNPIHIPCEGSEENFAAFIHQLKQQLEKRGFIDLAASIAEAPVPPSSRYPYGLIGGIQPDRFIVPENVVDKMTEYLIEGLSVSLVGARMMGKTSLLNFMGSEDYRRYYRRVFLNSDVHPLEYSQRLNGDISSMRFVSIDLEENIADGATSLMLHLASLIAQEMKVECKENTYQGTMRWMRAHIEKRSTKKGSFWIVLFDNFDAIAKFDTIPPTFFDDLHNLGYRYRLCYIAASRVEVRKFSRLKILKPFKVSPFFTMFKQYTLGVWNDSTAATFIFSPYGVKTDLFTDGDASLILSVTARHPRLLQLACEQLLILSSKGERKDIEQFFRYYQREADVVYESYWEFEMNRKEREWLKKCWKFLSQTSTRATDEMKAIIAGEENQQIIGKMSNLGLIFKISKGQEQMKKSSTSEQHPESTDMITFSRGFATFLTSRF